MPELRTDTWTMPAGRLGPDSPLPQFAGHRLPQSGGRKKISDKFRRMFEFGSVPGCLPYGLQSDFDRVQQPRTFRTAVLENDILRAAFLLELGGRLWSLVHKPSGRELLYVNPVFQPANLAIRNAWFTGGVEWNIGLRGHSVFTCSPLFAARVAGDRGPVLRLYEWERIRRVAFQMDFALPDGSPFLFVHGRILNPHAHEIPMYWWSNIAVNEVPGARTVAPAHSAVRFTYDGSIRETPIPVRDGVDRTYPADAPVAGDDFYAIEDGRRRWITSLDRDGRGLIQTSTPELRGRKLFRWGLGPGGRRWQEFLSPGGSPYIELQAGLARTQAECLPMPAQACWTWLEAYGPLEADPGAIHGEWDAAIRHVDERLDARLPESKMTDERGKAETLADRAPEIVLHRGSGWGALERQRRERDGEPPFCPDALVFDDASLGEPEAPWLALLTDGSMPDQDPCLPPASWMVQPEWRERLKAAVSGPGAGNWLAWLHLGVMAYYEGETDAARTAWETSLDRAPSAWACRNLAVLTGHAGNLSEAADLYRQAMELAPDLAPLAVETGRAFVRAERYRETLEQLEAMPESIQKLARVRALEAHAALELDNLERAEAILSSDLVVTDLREGEISLSDLWFRLQEKRLAAREQVPIDDALRERVRREFPPPKHLDFRMSARRSG
jgi:tetratricopeptide (TPR) repeat protein